ncbi:MAG: lysophospholipid acyltransferase family protein [Dehalococcoidia bacterium]|nr:lysophospholipid acyltransferase family protein [Dehalococcoidia bacterium]
MLQYWGIKSCSLLFKRLPLKVTYALACFLADFVFLFWRRGRKNILDNMAHVLGPQADKEAVRRVGKLSLRNYAKYIVDFLRFPDMAAEEIKGRVTFDGWHSFDDALSQGKGALFLGLHMGNWDIGAAAAALHDYPVSVIVERFPHPKLDEFIQGARRHLGIGTIPVEESARGVFRTLRNNEILGILVDRPGPDDGVPVRFFDAWTSVPSGPAIIALRTGSPVMTGGAIRRPDDSFLILVGKEIPYQHSGDYKRDVQVLTQSIMTSMEQMIRRYPEQWYMFRPMWPALVTDNAEDSL